MQRFNAWHNYALDLDDLVHHYREYERLMAHWHTVLPGQIFELPSEALAAEPEKWSDDLRAFAELDPAATAEEIAGQDADRLVMSASNLQVRQKISTRAVARWRRYEAHLETLISAFPDRYHYPSVVSAGSGYPG